MTYEQLRQMLDSLMGQEQLSRRQEGEKGFGQDFYLGEASEYNRQMRETGGIRGMDSNQLQHFLRTTIPDRTGQFYGSIDENGNYIPPQVDPDQYLQSGQRYGGPVFNSPGQANNAQESGMFQYGGRTADNNSQTARLHRAFMEGLGLPYEGVSQGLPDAQNPYYSPPPSRTPGGGSWSPRGGGRNPSQEEETYSTVDWGLQDPRGGGRNPSQEEETYSTVDWGLQDPRGGGRNPSQEEETWSTLPYGGLQNPKGGGLAEELWNSINPGIPFPGQSPNPSWNPRGGTRDPNALSRPPRKTGRNDRTITERGGLNKGAQSGSTLQKTIPWGGPGETFNGEFPPTFGDQLWEWFGNLWDNNFPGSPFPGYEGGKPHDPRDGGGGGGGGGGAPPWVDPGDPPPGDQPPGGTGNQPGQPDPTYPENPYGVNLGDLFGGLMQLFGNGGGFNFGNGNIDDFPDDLAGYGQGILGGLENFWGPIAAMLSGQGNNLSGPSFNPDFNAFNQGLNGEGGSPFQQGINNLFNILSGGTQQIDPNSFGSFNMFDQANQHLIQNGVPNQNAFFDSVMQMFGQQGQSFGGANQAFGNSSSALNYLLNNGVPLQDALLMAAQGNLSQQGQMFDPLGQGLEHILTQGLPGQQQLSNEVLQNLIGNIGRFDQGLKNSLGSLTSGQSNDPLLQQARGNVGQTIEGQGINPDFIQAARAGIYKDQERDLLGRINQLGGGAASLGSGLGAEMMTELNSDFINSMTLNAQDNLNRNIGMAGDLSNQAFSQNAGTASLLSGLGNQDFNQAMQTFSQVPGTVAPFQQMAMNFGNSLGQNALNFQGQPTNQVMNLIAQSMGLGNSLSQQGFGFGNEARQNQNLPFGQVQQVLDNLFKSGQFQTGAGIDQNQFDTNALMQLLSQSLGREQFTGGFNQGNLNTGLNYSQNMLNSLLGPLLGSTGASINQGGSVNPWSIFGSAALGSLPQILQGLGVGGGGGGGGSPWDWIFGWPQGGGF